MWSRNHRDFCYRSSHSARITPQCYIGRTSRQVFYTAVTVLREWLHATCRVMHIDISPQNVLLVIEDDISLKNIEEQESQGPSIPVISHEGPVYRSALPSWSSQGSPFLRTLGSYDARNLAIGIAGSLIYPVHQKCC